MLGQKEVEIARDLGMSQSRISIIVTSPLFQLELRRQLKKRQTRILAIEDRIIDASESGAELLKSIVNNEEITLPYRVDAGNKALTHLFGRILRQMPSIEPTEPTNPSDLSYEKRLEREVIFKETTYVPRNGSLSGSDNESGSEMPPLDTLIEEEDEALSDLLADDDDNMVDLPPEDKEDDKSG
jgi:hypothetical protein